MLEWPPGSPPSAFALRRERLGRRFARPALFVSGWARPRNFPGNPYPFRAESHFLYLVGRSLEGAALVFDGDGWVLFVQPPSPAEALWSGPQPSLEELSRQLALPVRPIEDLDARGTDLATLPAQDADSAAWQSILCDRPVQAGTGDELEGIDAELADAMIAVRLTHDPAGLAQLRFAAESAAAAHRAGMAGTVPGLREAAVRASMDRVLMERGLTHAYHPIVTARGDVLHNAAHDGVLGADDLVLADVGGETPEGWASDLTRTWPAGGRFTPTQRALYSIVLVAQRRAIDAVAPGVGFREVHRTAGVALAEGLVAEGILRGDPTELYDDGVASIFFPHGVGHLLGLDVHDLEDLGDRAGYGPGRTRNDHPSDRYLRLDRDLEPNMVVTIEPGLYRIESLLAESSSLGRVGKAIDRSRLERFSDVRGIRIEDEVLVTADGCEILTAAAPKDPDAVEDAMRGRDESAAGE